MWGDKECSFSSVTDCGRVWRKGARKQGLERGVLAAFSCRVAFAKECLLPFPSSCSCCFCCRLLWLKVSETALTSCACVSPEQVSSRWLQPSLLPTLHHQGHTTRGGPGGGLRSAQVRLRSHRNHCKYADAFFFAPSMLVLSFCVVTLVSCFLRHKSFAPRTAENV